MPVLRQTEVVDVIYFEGTKAMTATIKATAVEDLGNGRVRFQTTAAHGFVATEAVPIQMEIEGTTNYDNVRQVVNISAVDKFDIVSPFVAETPAGTETIKFNVAPGRPFMLKNFEMSLDTAPTTAEDLTIDLDSSRGANYDHNIRTIPILGLTDKDWRIKRDERKSRLKDDRIRFAYTNTDTRTITMSVEYEIIS